jgi:hypothetical protein
MHRCKQSSKQNSVFDTASSTYKTAYTDACKNIPYYNCMYSRLPEDEPLGSKHVEDIKKLKIKILI